MTLSTSKQTFLRWLLPVAACLVCFAGSIGAAISTIEYRETEALWKRVVAGERGGPAQAQLLARHEDALEVLLDMLYGSHKEVSGDVIPIDTLVKQLGSKSFKERKAAHKKLKEMGAVVISELEAFKNHEDPEVRMRVREIIEAVTPLAVSRPNGKSFETQATGFLLNTWPVVELGNVMAKNVERLAKVELPPASPTVKRAIIPFLAGLRHSDDIRDREKIVDFYEAARDEQKGIAIKMTHGHPMSMLRIGYNWETWRNAPSHDYSELQMSALDVRKPKVFMEILPMLPASDETTLRLRECLEKTGDIKIQRAVADFLWVRMADPRALEMLRKDLQSSELGTFTKAVYTITQCYVPGSDAGYKEVEPYLRGDDKQRKLAVLNSLPNFHRSKTMELASMELANAMGSKDQEIRAAAKQGIIKSFGWNRFHAIKKIAETHENDEVRNQLKQMYNEHKLTHRNKGKRYYQPIPDIHDEEDVKAKEKLRAKRFEEIGKTVALLKKDQEAGRKQLLSYGFSDIPLLRQIQSSSGGNTNEIELAITEIKKRYWEDNRPVKPVDELEKELALYFDNAGQYDRAVDISTSGLPRVMIADPEFTNLWMLADIPIYYLNLYNTRVSDLTPLKGMPLKRLLLVKTPVRDLSPLKDSPLDELNLKNTLVDDVTPLKGTPITRLSLSRTYISDISPLSGNPLKYIYMTDSSVKDISPLKDIKLESVYFDPLALLTGFESVRKIDTLKYVNGRPLKTLLQSMKQSGSAYFCTPPGQNRYWNEEGEHRIFLKNLTGDNITFSGKWSELTDDKSYIKPDHIPETALKPGETRELVFKCLLMDSLKDRPSLEWTANDGKKDRKGARKLSISRRGYYAEGNDPGTMKKAEIVLNKPTAVFPGNHESWTGLDDASAKAVLIKGKDGLRLQMTVVDDVLLGNREAIAENDSIVLYLDFRSEKERALNMKGPRPFLVRAAPNLGTKTADIWRAHSRQGACLIKDCEVTSKVTDKGYWIELFLPYAGIHKYHGTPGESFFMDIGFLDRDNKATKGVSRFFWSGYVGNGDGAQNWGKVEGRR